MCLVAVLKNGLDLLGVSMYWQQILNGMIIVDAAKVDISQYNEATANYILYLNSTFVGFQHCAPNFESYAGVPLTAGYSYSVSIVDWKTGVEVVAIGGGGCLYDILPILMDNIP